MPGKRTSKRDFERFQRSFRTWQRRLGLLDWRVVFVRAQLGRDYAQIHMDHAGCIATVALADSVEEDGRLGFNPVVHGRHEALELLLGGLVWLAESRAVSGQEINTETHRIIRRLENLLTKSEARP